MAKKSDIEYDNYYAVKMTKNEMLKILALLYGKEADYETLKKYARNMGGLSYHLVECYENALKEEK